VGAVNPAAATWQELTLTAHPLQRCGAWAVAVLAGRADPGAVTSEDLDTVAGRLVEDITAVSTQPTNPDWWKVLFALYPNSKPTHAQRTRDPDVLRPLVAALFTPDAPGADAPPCTFCSRPTTMLWAKSHMPLFDTTHAVNTLPPRTAGWPVCRGCRVALWTLPYGAWVTAGSATVLMCGNPAVERRFVARNVTRATRIQQVGFAGVPADACAEAITLAALRAHAADAPADAVLWSFKNDNQEPWLRVSATRQAIGRLLVRIESDPATRQGWRRLRRALARPDKDPSGYTAIARMLFVDEHGSADRLLYVLLRESTDPPADPVATDGWRRLARAYQEEMYGMDVERLAPARELVTKWIMAGNRRSRFNEYAKVAPSNYALHKLLMTASARLLRDGDQPPDISGITPTLLSTGPDGWRWRAQLFFEVVADLVAKRAEIGRKPDDEDDNDEPGGDPDDAIRLDPYEEEVYA
jgi:CRISPR-associated protein Cst1